MAVNKFNPAQGEKKTINISLDQFDQACLNIGIAQSFLAYLTADLAQDDPTFNGIGQSNQVGLMDGLLCLLSNGVDGLLPDSKGGTQ